MEVTPVPAREIFSQQVCYTPLVFGRVNKKLGTDLTVDEIKQLVQKIIADPQTSITKNGKNYYLQFQTTELVINSFNYRLITANKK